MRAYLEERRTLLLVILTVMILATLAACSNLGIALPATATPAALVPTIALPQATNPPATDSPTGLQTLDPAGAAVQQAVDTPSAETPPAVDAQAAPPCAGQPVCANLLVTQSGKPALLGVSSQGLLTSPAQASPTDGTGWVIDTGTPSPDGKWGAFTSLGHETGGPVFLQNLETGEWVNLIEQMNAHPVEGQPNFPVDLYWDVIGWFPDSQRLMIGPSDLSSVVIVDRASYAAQVIGFPGGGKGGRMFVTLAPNGSQFLFLGENEAGLQTVSSYDLATGQVRLLHEVAYESGFLSNPRFSPDSMRIAYMVQSGQPENGLTYSMNLMEREGGIPTKLMEGNLSMTAPNWSPDGSQIAFTRNDSAPTLIATAGQAPSEPQGNIWIVSIKDGSQQQVTFIDGLARSPVWAKDGKTLAFVTGTGEVDLASLDQPGQLWQAAGPSELPELTNVFFLP